MPRLPWRELAKLALLGTMLAGVLVMVDVRIRGNGNIVSLVQPGEQGPSASVFHTDFPKLELPGGLGHDGQQFYAIARQPMHLDAVAPQLDRPQYRLQRPLLPWLAWLLHPQGGGAGLVDSLLLVELAAMFAGGLALGAVCVRLGGPTWPAAVFPLLPGSIASARIIGADTLAVALVLAAIACALSDRRVAAVALAVLAVLAKEPVLLVLAGYALYRRDRFGAALVGAPVAVAGGWALYLRWAVPTNGHAQVVEFGLPFRGLWDASDAWIHGHEVFAMATVLAGLVLGVWVVRAHGLGWPLGWATVLELGFTVLLGVSVVGLNFNGTRTTLPLQALVLIGLAVPAAARRRDTDGDESTRVSELAT